MLPITWRVWAAFLPSTVMASLRFLSPSAARLLGLLSAQFSYGVDE
jgi:hypothetical protein